MPAAHRKVIVRRFLGDTLPGYLPASAFVRNGGISLLDLGGRLNSLPLSDIKHISYVRDFNLSDTANPERITRRAFLARPRNEGLWVRLTFRSSDPRNPDILEGLAPTDITLLDDLLNDSGIQITPPDTRSNTQRIYIPRSSIADLQILALITSPSRRKAAPTPKSAKDDLQEELFHSPLPPNTRPN